eukprot:388453-Pelagomonas_calceolata.AAC.1
MDAEGDGTGPSEGDKQGEGGDQAVGEGHGEGVKQEQEVKEEEGAGEQGKGGGGDTEMAEGGGEGGDQGGGQREEEDVPPSLDTVLAGELLRDVIRAKASPEALLEWMGTRGVEAAVGEGPRGSVKVLMRALLAAGSKSPTHLNVALERYATSLRELLSR